MANDKISIVTQIDMHIGTCQTGRTVGPINTVNEKPRRNRKMCPFCTFCNVVCMSVYFLCTLSLWSNVDIINVLALLCSKMYILNGLGRLWYKATHILFYVITFISILHSFLVVPSKV
jgi:hypothetical protein